MWFNNSNLISGVFPAAALGNLLAILFTIIFINIQDKIRQQMLVNLSNTELFMQLYTDDTYPLD
jgi:hypothetical protein